ncbi:MAG: hypothetical protein IT260_15455 [Saprospiraceae bacterium]|nr:hypothetical protein [Saprospiraceae bacterium]
MKLFSTLILVFFVACSAELTAQCQLTIGAITVPNCNGASNGSITSTISNGEAPYEFTWSGPVSGVANSDNATYVITGLPAGTYVVSVTDINGCTAIKPAQITQGPALSLSMVVSNITCASPNSGSIDLTVTGGAPGYAYNWSHIFNAQDPSGLAAGTYTVTVIDAYGCSKTTSATLTNPPNFTLSTVPTPASCFGEADGALNLTVTGGTAPFTYNWSHLPGNNDPEDLNNISSKTYTVTVTDANACTKSIARFVPQPSKMFATGVPTPATCAMNDGSINLLPSGGLPPYTFNWSHSEITEDVDELSAGNYEVTLTDSHGCTATNSFTIVFKPNFTLDIAPTPSTCGNAEGTANLTITGGAAPFTYQWSNGATTQNLTGLAAGYYSVTATSNVGCSGSKSGFVGNSDGPMITLVATNAGCSGTTGYIDITVTGGTPGYTFQWSNGNTTQDLFNLSPGTYTVTVIDATGCMNIGSTVIAGATPIVPTIQNVAVTCYGGNMGGISIGVSGGVLPYTYIWNNGATTQNIQFLTANTYTVTITDGQGCTASTSATVTQWPQLNVSATVTQVECYGGATGTIDVTASGGAGIFTYLWTNGQTTQDINGLVAGQYCVSITDQAGCMQNMCWTIAQPTLVSMQTQTIAASCSGAAEGGIDLTLSGGTPGYSFNWNNSGTTEDLINLPAGAYTVTVTDGNACTYTQTVTVPASASTATVVAIASPASACGLADGGLQVEMNNAEAPYSFHWANGTGTGDGSGMATTPFLISGLNAGVYQLTITDAKGCTATTEQAIGSPMSLNAVATPISSCLSADGTITVNISGATPEYAFSWTSGAQTGSGSNLNASPITLDNLQAGDYRISVTNTAGCFAFAEATVAQTASLDIAMVSTPATCNGEGNGALNTTVSGGTQPYTYQWTTTSTTAGVSSLLAGIYTVTVTDFSGCTATASATVGQPDPIILQLAVTPILCQGGNTGSIDLSEQGGTPGFTYQWSNNTNTQDLANLVAGTYTVTAVDSQGCSKTEEAFVAAASAGFTLSAIGTPATGCLLSDGELAIQVVGGTPNYAYQWSNGTTTGDGSAIPSSPFVFGGLATGTYTVTVTNGDGCTNTVTASVDASNTLSASLFVNPVSCDGQTNGSIQVTIAGGQVPNYSYAWSDGVTSGNDSGLSSNMFTIPNLPLGNYSITLTNGVGCTLVRTAVMGTAVMQVFASAVSPTCGSPSGYLNISLGAVGNQPPFSYAWETTANSGSGTAPSSPFNITGLQAGVYTVTVTNANGCSGIRTVTMYPPSGTFTLASLGTAPACFGGSTGSLSLTIINVSSPPYVYEWSNGIESGNGQSPSNPILISNLPAGNYNVTITDNSGCTGSVSQAINPGTAPALVVTSTNPNCFGASSGSIQTTFTWANPPYTYIWSGPAGVNYFLANPANLPAGAYTLTVTNSIGCTSVHPAVLLEEPALLSANIAAAGCSGSSALVIANGGTPPYTYLWNTGSSNDTITGLSTGSYSVLVQDANGCGANDTEFIQNNPGLCAVLRGGVYEDLVDNCLFDNEPPLAGWLVKAMGDQTFYGLTDGNGQFLINVIPNDYVLEVVAPDPVWMPCINTNTVSVTQPNDTVDAGAWMVGRQVLCPAMYVNISTSFLRRCSDNNYYQIQYCNNGSANAENAYLDVVLDPFLTAVSATRPFVNLPNHTIRFDLGTVVSGDCGTISLRVKVGCNATLGQTHCTEAHIYPDTLCLPPNANWSGASIQVRGECDADSVRFIVKNTGHGALANKLNYIVIEDHVMLMQGDVQVLSAGDSLFVNFGANGSTWRLEVEQALFHPGQSKPSATIEGCTTTGGFSTGFVTQFSPNDQDPWIDIDCQRNIGSWDPNDKQGFPLGYGEEHYIRPGTEINYLIRFQNTGTDTAFNIYVLDTLSEWLDPATFRPGVASHAYDYDLFGTGILRFDFNNILLPDSNVNEAASHGFVQFTIRPKADAPLRTLIENQAAIYFDLNEPVFTNTTRHKLGENFITTGLWNPEQPRWQLLVQPNPMAESALLRIAGLDNAGELHWRLSDQTGRVVREARTPGTGWVLQRGDLPAGFYFIRVERAGVLLGTGKVVVQE